MKKLILLMLLASFADVFGQNITRIEYFFDTDPGYGNGIPVSLTPAPDVTVGFYRNTAGLTPGIHRFFVRAMQTSGKWSIVHNDLIIVSGAGAAADVTALEYFFDTDPGFGNGISVPVTPGQNITATWQLNTTGLTTGIHRVFYRARNSNGKWSIVFWDLMFITPLIAKVTAAEMFVVIFQRNHLGVMTANPVPLSGPGAGVFDFTTSSAKTYGGVLGCTELEPGVWGLISGDADGNGQVSNQDKVSYWNPQAGQQGYLESDFDLNGQMNHGDKNDLWLRNTGKGTQTPN